MANIMYVVWTGGNVPLYSGQVLDYGRIDMMANGFLCVSDRHDGQWIFVCLRST